MELYNTCTRLIEKGKTAGMQKKLDIFFANDRLTEEEYTKLCAQLEQIVTTGITTVAALVAWWQNNSFTPEAIKADAEYDRLKMQGK